MSDLSSKRCVPCEGGTPPLPVEKIQELISQTPGWLFNGDKIIKQFIFKDFKESVEFVNKIGSIAEKEGHHPDISITYNKVALALTTHAAKGLTENDFILAAKINKIT